MADKRVRDKLRFRKLLGSLSDGLGSQNLRELKNLCYDNIGEQKREQVSDGLALFNVLLEQELITREKPQYLCVLLDEIGRKDLSSKVQDYIKSLAVEEVEPDTALYELDFSHLKVISAEVGKDWKMLARHLRLDEITIQSIHSENGGNLHEASLQALLRWQSLSGDNATPQALKKALTDMRLMAIVHKHFNAV